LGAAGTSVVVNYASDKAGADKTVADIKAKGGQTLAVKGDVSRSAHVKHLFEETRKAYGKLDVLVNNAGVFKFAQLEQAEEAEYQRQFGINVRGTIQAISEALSLFGSEGGSVINISSIVSRMGVLASELGPQDPGQFDQPGMVESEGTHAAGFISGTSRRISKPRSGSVALASPRMSPRLRCFSPAAIRVG
jgi:3-oxoacyl-[acyl-carrier protein] reductase